MSKGARPEVALEVQPLAEFFERDGPERAGPFGTSFTARDKSSGKLVTIQRPAADAELTRRFVAEALQVKRLWHPHILRLYSVWRDQDGPYAALEHCEKGSLEDVIAKGPLPEEQALAVARGLALALEYAHQQGLVHNGLRPNCLFFAAAGAVKLAGFGTHRLGSDWREIAVDDPYVDDSDASCLTSDQRHDIVAFGKLVYHATTGEAPRSVAIGLLAPVFREVVSRCVDPDLEKRLATSEDLVKLLRSGPEPILLDKRGRGPAPPLRSPAPPSAPAARSGTPPAARSAPLPDSTPASRSATPPQPSDGAGASSPVPTARPASRTSPATGRGTTASRKGGGGVPLADLPWQSMKEGFEPIGKRLEGGMGFVVQCREKATGRVVAVKRVKSMPGMDETLLQRFHREANSIARLSHPNILTLYLAARDEDGDYIVLEWAAGGGLRERMDELGGKLPLHEVLDVARRVGAALGYAHGKGVIHRDVKPHNILLTEDGTPKLADFGLARATDDVTITRTTGGAGTPIYMAPEQWISARDSDSRADLYALGKVIFHLATGQSPVRFEPKKLPPELRSTVIGLTRERRDERFQTAEEFLNHLERTQRRVRALKRALWVGAVFVVVVAAAIAFAGGMGAKLDAASAWVRGLFH